MADHDEGATVRLAATIDACDSEIAQLRAIADKGGPDADS